MIRVYGNSVYGAGYKDYTAGKLVELRDLEFNIDSLDKKMKLESWLRIFEKVSNEDLQKLEQKYL